MTPAPDILERFRLDLDALAEPRLRLGVAVSGGPDSLALLLLAAAARPGSVEAATVDHGLRSEAAAEAATVAGICANLGVPHATLAIDPEASPTSSLQAWARKHRYRSLGEWGIERGIGAIATAHHSDDQAETILMRLARGAGIGGLAGIQRRRRLSENASIILVRPLLDWRREDLRALVADAGLDPVDDPSNADDRFDRTHARQLLAATRWLEASRLSASASNLADAEQALDWVAGREFRARSNWADPFLTLDPADLPRELRRRLLVTAIATLGGGEPRGAGLMSALDTLDAGGITTLAGLKLEGLDRDGARTWRLSRAEPRRSL